MSMSFWTWETENIYKGFRNILRDYQNRASNELQEDLSRIIGDENFDYAIKPLKWNGSKRLLGFSLPYGMPIWGSETPGWFKVRFARKWEERWGENSGKKFQDYGKVISISGFNGGKKTEQIKSFMRYYSGEKTYENLAFIYLGILWYYEYKGETLEQAAKRFINTHPEIRQEFDRSTEDLHVRDDIHIREIYRSGGLIFKGTMAIMRRQYEADLASSAWALLVRDGYMPEVEKVYYGLSYYSDF